VSWECVSEAFAQGFKVVFVECIVYEHALFGCTVYNFIDRIESSERESLSVVVWEARGILPSIAELALRQRGF
jgi:hypothetical protein